MLARIGESVIVDAQFIVTSTGLGATGVAPTATLYRNGVSVGSAGTVTEAGQGVYRCAVSAALVTVAGDYVVVWLTASTTVTQRELSSAWYVGQTWVERIDATLSTIAASIVSAATIAAAVWANAIRTLTEVLVSTDNNPTNALTARRGDTYIKSLTGLGSITGYTKFWLDVKDTEDGLQPDDDATVQIVTGSGFGAATGLIYLNGETTTAAWGSLAVDDAALGDITITLEADATVLLLPGRYFYGIKALVAGDPTTLLTGVFIVYPGYTAAIN